MTLDLSMAAGRSAMMASVAVLASKFRVSPSLCLDADEVAAAQDSEIVDVLALDEVTRRVVVGDAYADARRAVDVHIAGTETDPSLVCLGTGFTALQIKKVEASFGLKEILN
jgi:hypothetical protein